VDKLPLKDDAAIHKFILLAGPRWSPVPHADAGVSSLDIWGNGYVKISCEDFPKASQNLKWASDTLDKMIEEANVRHISLRLLNITDLAFRTGRIHSLMSPLIFAT